MKQVKFSDLRIGDKFKVTATCEAIDVKIEPATGKRHNAQCIQQGIRHFIHDNRIVFVEIADA